jgi:uncharacterized protein
MIKILIKYRFLFLVLVILLTVLACLKLSSIKVNTDFSQFLPDNDPEYLFYKDLKSEIKDDNSILIIGIDHEPSIYNIKFLQKTQALIDSLNQVDGIYHINALTNISYPVKSLFGILTMPYLPLSDSLDLSNYKNKIKKDFHFTQNFVNKDETVLFVWLEIKDLENPTQIENSLLSIENIRLDFPDLKTYLWGKQYLQKELNEITKNSTSKIVLWVLLFLVVALVFIYRSLWSVVFSVLLVVISFLLFIGGMISLNRPFNIMSNLFPTIILIVGISDIIHLSIKYNSEINNGHSHTKAFSNSIKEIGLALFITSFTTAIGFFILQISPMKVLREFGLEAGIAVILTFVITLILSPVLFSNFGSSKRFELSKIFQKYSEKLMLITKKLYHFPNKTVVFYGLFMVIGIIGIFSINTNNLQYSIPNNNTLKSNYAFFENHLGGSRTFELVFQATKNHTLNEPDVLNQLNSVQNYLDSLPNLTAVKSPLLYYRTMHKVYNHSYNESASFNLDKLEIIKYEKQFINASASQFLMNKNKTVFKFNAQMKDIGRHDVAKINQSIIDEVNKRLDSTKATARISGMDHLFDRSHDKRIKNMIYGIILAILLVSLILGIIFKNISITLLALLLNVIPIVIAAGILGFANLELRAGSSIIFTIAFVIVVDDTIHLLSKFQWHRKLGDSVEDALNHALNECGKAIIATSFILFGGFIILMLSDYNEIFTLGFLMSIVILITLSVDLILAPILILKFFKKHL